MEQLKLNMIPNGVNPVFHASQYDKGRQIRFVLDETLSSAEVTVSYRAKDGTEYGNVQMSVSGNAITDTIPEEVLTDYGIIEGEVNIDGIGSLNFFVEVEKDAYDGGVITTQTASGPIATFETNIETAFVSLKSDITPVQDLHGYSKPWSGGGGKNKLNCTVTTQTKNGVTLTVVKNSANQVTQINVTGTATAGVSFTLGTATIEAGTYVLNGYSGGSSVGTKYINYSGIANAYGSNVTSTISETKTTTASLQIANGAETGFTIYPMIRLSGTTADYEPYSNICPISGFSALNVTRTGVNLAKYWKNAYINANGTIITNNNNALCELGYLKSGEKIAFNHYQNTYGCGIAVYSDSSYTNKIDVSGNIQSNVSTLTLEHSGYYLFWFNVGTNTASETFINDNSLGVYVGETVGTFEPYNGQTATVNFGQTVYGGQVDVTNGKVTLTHGYIEFNGSENWINVGGNYPFAFQLDTGISNKVDHPLLEQGIITNLFPLATAEVPTTNAIRWQINGLNGRLYIYDYAHSGDIAGFKQMLSDNKLQMLYKLATPIEITTTPENLTAISGENNVYGDNNGDTTVEYYIEV